MEIWSEINNWMEIPAGRKLPGGDFCPVYGFPVCDVQKSTASRRNSAQNRTSLIFLPSNQSGQPSIPGGRRAA